MDDFNQSSQAGIWGRLENALYEDIDLDDLRTSVFAGPIFHNEDQSYRGYQIPVEYWKLILFEQAGQLKARAFMLTQDLDRLQVLMALDEFRVYQITVAELEERTGFAFPRPVQDADDLLMAQSSTRTPTTYRIRHPVVSHAKRVHRTLGKWPDHRHVLSAAIAPERLSLIQGIQTPCAERVTSPSLVRNMQPHPRNHFAQSHSSYSVPCVRCCTNKRSGRGQSGLPALLQTLLVQMNRLICKVCP